MKKLPDEIFEVEFTPRTEGAHTISVLVGSEHIRGSPFKIAVLDLSAVRVIGLKNDRVGIEQRFNGCVFFDVFRNFFYSINCS